MNKLEVYFQRVNWHETSSVNRFFVRNKNNAKPSGTYSCFSNTEDHVLLSIIIPTSDAFRNGNFPILLSQINTQNLKNYEIIVIKGDIRQGRAINIGAAIAKGKYLLTLDDDTSLPDDMTFIKLVDVMEQYPEVGIAGGNNIIPSNASAFVKRVMREIPRRSWEPVKKITESDLAEHPCMIMRTKEFKNIGGENELLPRGLDPYLRQAFRKAGKRIVLVPNVIYHHLPPDSLGKLLQQFFRNGRQAAYVNRHFPQWIIETPSKHGEFEPKVSFWRRVLRYFITIPQSIFSGKILWTACQISYTSGFIYGFFTVHCKKPIYQPPRQR